MAWELSIDIQKYDHITKTVSNPCFLFAIEQKTFMEIRNVTNHLPKDVEATRVQFHLANVPLGSFLLASCLVYICSSFFTSA